MTRNLRGGKGITHCRLPYGHVTLIAYYSIADRQPVVRCNWRRANWTWVSRILARTDDKRGWKTRNKSSLCRWQFRLIPFGGRVASGTAEETSRRNGSRLPHAPLPPPLSKNPMRSSLHLTELFLLFFAVACAEDESMGPVFVKEPPNRVDFSNGTGAVVECQARGNPQPDIIWVRADGSAVGDVPGLRQVSLGGNYNCKVFIFFSRYTLVQ